MNPLDLPGPAFLALYVALGAVALVAALVLKRWAQGPGGEPSEALLDSLTPYDVAFLRGGPDAAAQAAIASLVHRGRLAVEDTDLVVPPGAGAEGELVGDGVYRGVPRRAPDHPLDAAILAAVGTRRSFVGVQREASSAAESIGVSLERAQLMRSKAALGGRNLAVGAPAAALIVLGTVKLFVGLSRDRPVLFLALLLLLTLPLLSIRVKPGCTRLGDRVLALLTDRNDALRMTASTAPQQLGGDDLALAVGLFGSSVLVGGALASVAMLWPAHALASTTSTWGGGASSCGTSCGGSSCGGSSCGGGCGGGCGGCGG